MCTHVACMWMGYWPTGIYLLTVPSNDTNLMETRRNWFFWNLISRTKCKEAVRSISVALVLTLRSWEWIFETVSTWPLDACSRNWELSCLWRACPVSQAHKGAFDHIFCGSVKLHSLYSSFVRQEGSLCACSCGWGAQPMGSWTAAAIDSEFYLLPSQGRERVAGTFALQVVGDVNFRWSHIQNVLIPDCMKEEDFALYS